LKRWQLWLGVIISAVFLWLALGGLALNKVWGEMQSANYWWLIPSVTTYFAAVWARTWRWDYMLRPLKQIPLTRLFPVVVIGYMGNNIYPFRAGEVLRSYVLRRREDVPMSGSLATVIVERVFDGLVMLVFVFAALPFAPIPSDTIQTTVVIASIAFFGALIVFFAIAAVPARAEILHDGVRLRQTQFVQRGLQRFVNELFEWNGQAAHCRLWLGRFESRGDRFDRAFAVGE
jgi:uncharacterized protein (TIRG00374 family)